jgi:hypothetical protein
VEDGMTKKTARAMEPITSFKGFDKNLQCRGFQFELGKTFIHEGDVRACNSGFHACEYPLGVFNYYSPAKSRFAVVEQTGELSRGGGDSKVSSRAIHIKEEIGIQALITAALEFIMSRCDPASSAHATGDMSASSATGGRSASSATGYSSASSATGGRSASSATGYSSASSATGDMSASSATGGMSASSATGGMSASSATGYSSASSATGDMSASSATGGRSASSATGDMSASSATGDRSASSATGDMSASSATGYRSASSATGDMSASLTTGFESHSEILPYPDGNPMNAIAIAAGGDSWARAPEGCAIVLCYRDHDGKIIHVRASKVGENGVKPGVWYSLDENGEFMECAE